MSAIAFTGGRGNEGLSALLSAFGMLAGTSVLAECTFTYSRLLRLMDPQNVRKRPVPSIPRFNFDADRCSHCFKCLDICKHNAIMRYGDLIHYAEHRCTACGSCIRWCPLSVLQFEYDDDVLLSYAESRYGPLLYTDSIVDALHQPAMTSVILEQARQMMNVRKIHQLHIRLPRGQGEAAAIAASSADAVVIVTAPYPYALADLKSLVLFSRKCGHLPLVLINKVHPSNIILTDVLNTYCQGEGIPVAGKIPYDPLFPEAEQLGLSVIEYDSATNCTSAVKEAWINISQRIANIT